MAARQVVITGMGLVTPLGESVAENWLNLQGKKTGIGCYPHEKHPESFHYAGRVIRMPAQPDIAASRSNQMKFLNRGSLLGFAAAQEAISQSPGGIAAIPPERRALYLGAGDFSNVGYEFLFPAIRQATDGRYRDIDYRDLNLVSLRDVHPWFLLESIHNNLFSFLSASFELKGANTTLAGASPCGAQALELACQGVRHERADAALVVGCGSWITTVPRYEMMDLGMLSRCRDGVRSLKPFDRRRDGFIAGEGGAALLLEAEDHARERGAAILGAVEGMGSGMEFTEYRKWGVPPAVSLNSMKLALADAACDVDDLAFICPHGSATVKGDRSELRAIMGLLETDRSAPPLCGMKGYTAHMGAASDIAEIILGIEAVKSRLVPATLHFNATEEEFAELNISSSHQPHNKVHFLSVSCGLGGQCTAAVIRGEP